MNRVLNAITDAAKFAVKSSPEHCAGHFGRPANCYQWVGSDFNNAQEGTTP